MSYTPGAVTKPLAGQAPSSVSFPAACVDPSLAGRDCVRDWMASAVRIAARDAVFEALVRNADLKTPPNLDDASGRLASRASRSASKRTIQGRIRHEAFDVGNPRSRCWRDLLAVSARVRCRPQAETPKKGGILKFVVPDEPPSFDGHKETTFALIHPIAPFYSVLIRVDPENPGQANEFVCDLCTEMPKPDRRRQDLHVQDPQGRQVPRRLAADRQGRARLLPAHHLPAAGRLERAQGAVQHGRERDRARRRDGGVQAQASLRARSFPRSPRPSTSSTRRPMLDKDQHWYEKNVMGSGPFVFEERQAGALVKGKRNPNYYHTGQALSRRLRGDLRQDADAARAGDPRRPGGDRVPRLPAQEPRRSRRRARQGHHGAGERLELRAARHAQPQEEALRRRARAQGAHAGGRPLGRLQGPIQDRHRQGGGRRGLPGPSAGGNRRPSSSSSPATGPTSTSRARKPRGC